MFSPDSTFSERASELERLKIVYAKLVFVCEEFDMEIELVKEREKLRKNRAVFVSTSNPSSCESSPEKRITPRLSGNYASFAESHRIIVMDAIRTDMKGIAESILQSNGDPPSWEADQENIERRMGAPRVTVLPVSVCDGLPELMLVDPPQPKPSQAVASGQPPIWRSSIASQMIHGARHADTKTRGLMMRLVNILSAYAVHDPENGYCQGMSDLAALFVCLEEEDALAFACFERLMRSARQNFCHDESGIRLQLVKISEIIADTDPELHTRLVSLGAEDCMFAYRMVVVLLRRELPLPDVMTLWEVKWALEAKRDQDDIGSCVSGNGSPNSRTISLNKGTMTGSNKILHETLENIDSLLENASLDSPETEGKKFSVKSSTNSSTWRGKKLRSRNSAPDFILQYVAAVIKSYRKKMLKECQEADDILRLFNGIDIDFWQTMSQAKKQHKAYCEGITVMQSLYS